MRRTRVARTAPFVLGAAALVLRLAAVPWGLPLSPLTSYYHPDEKKIVLAALTFPGDILTRMDLRYPTAWHYALGVATWPLRVAARAWPELLTPDRVYLWHTVAARLAAVGVGAATVVVVWRLGRAWYGPRAGWLAAALAAVAPVLVLNNALATTDGPAAFLVVLALGAAWRVAEHGRLRDHALAGVVVGLLVGTKYTGAVVLAPMAVAVVARAVRSPRGWRALLDVRGPAVMAAVAVGVFALTTPVAVLRPSALTDSLGYELGTKFRRGWEGGAGWLALRMWTDALGELAEATGIAFAAVAVAGLGVAAARRTLPDALVLSLVVTYYAAMGDKVDGRYTLVVLPALSLAAGRAMAALAPPPSPDAAPIRWRSTAAKVVAGMAVGATAAHALLALATRLQPDTRTRAAAWLVEHVPPGAAVCMGDVGPFQDEEWELPRLPDGRFAVADGLEVPPDWVVLSGGSIKDVGKALRSDRLSPDLVWDPADAQRWVPDPPPPPEVFRFYKDLLAPDAGSPFELAATFTAAKPVAIEFPAPEIRVYRRR